MTLWNIIHETLIMMGFTFGVGIAFAYLLKLLTLFFNYTNKEEISATIWHFRIKARAYRMAMSHAYSTNWDKKLVNTITTDPKEREAYIRSMDNLIEFHCGTRNLPKQNQQKD